MFIVIGVCKYEDIFFHDHCNPKKEVEGALRQNFLDLVHEHGY